MSVAETDWSKPGSSRTGTATAAESGPFPYLLQRGNGGFLLHGLFAFFALFTLFMALHHVPWRDEAQPWLYARNLDWRGLFYMTRHNGHPLLWFVCVKILQLFGAGYLGMMVLNWAFCVGGIWLLFYQSRLPLAARIGFAFAPVCYLEIAFTARDYTIALPLCFLAAILYPSSRQQPVRFSLVLALLASTNVYAAAVFVGISFQFLLEQAFGFGEHPFTLRPLLTRYLAANLMLALGATVLVLALAPIRFPGDPFPNVTSHLRPEFHHLFSGHYALVSLPLVALGLLPRGPGKPRVVGGILIVVLAVIPSVAYLAGARHLFMLGLGTVYFCWIYFDSFLQAESLLRRKLGAVGIALAVTLGILISAYVPRAYVTSANMPVNDSRNASEAIIRAGLDRPDTLIVATDSFRITSLYPFLQSIHSACVPPQFGPSPQSFALDAYVHFVDDTPTVTAIKPLALDLAQRNPSQTILVIGTSEQMEKQTPDYGPLYHLEPLYQTPVDPQQVPVNEIYQIYLLVRP